MRTKIIEKLSLNKTSYCPPSPTPNFLSLAETRLIQPKRSLPEEIWTRIKTVKVANESVINCQIENSKRLAINLIFRI